MNTQFLGDHKVVHLSTEEMRDRYQGSWASDVIDMQDYQDIIFIIDQTSGVGAAELSVQRCNNVTPYSTAGLPGGRYRYSTTPDAWSAWAVIPTSSGFVTAITPDKTYEIHVRGDEVSGSSGWKFLRLNADQTTDSPVDVNMTAILFNGRFQDDIDARTSLV